VTTAALAGVVLALHLRDPHEPGSWGRCLTAELGLWCPACGGLRAVHDLTHLRLADSMSSNLLLWVWAPVVLWLLASWWRRRWAGRAYAGDPTRVLVGCVLLVVSAVGFAVARNLPGSWLAP